MELEFIPLDYDYLTLNEKTYMRVFGKTPKKESCCIIDELENYFYVLSKNPEKILKKIEKIKDIAKTKIEEKKFLGKKVDAIRVSCDFSKMKEVRRKIKKIDDKIKIKEHDIPLITKYIISKKIRPLKWYKAEGEILNDTDLGGLPSSVDSDYVLKISKVKKVKKQKKFNPKVLAFDIESEEFEIGKGKILMISLVSNNVKKVLTWKKPTKEKDFIEYFKNEKEMLEKFQEYVNKIKPDILTGYFSDGFDLPYIRNRARKNKIEMKLGIANEKILFSKGRMKRARIKGLVHIDLFKFIEVVYSQYLQSETLSLNEVSSELLGEKKIVVDHLNKKTKDITKKEWDKFFEYNLQDSVLTFKLFEKIWPDILEFAKVIQEPLYYTSRYTFSKLVENYMLHNLEKFNEIAEEKPSHEEIRERRSKRKTEGAFVFQPEAGLYENISIFDFTSMHTSIISSFNISKATLLDKKKKDSYESPEVNFQGENKKFCFSKKKGFFSELSSEIMDLRKKYKKEYKKNPTPITRARSNAFKVLSASIHGYIAYFGARYYSYECSSSILAFVRKFNKQIIEKVQNEGHKVIFSDTDSVGFVMGGKTKKEVLKLLKKLNDELPGNMELELDGFYKRGIWVTKRSGKFGAKKKYALIDDKGDMKIRGFETVRRDWCNLSRKTQNKVLEKILKTGNEKEALKYTRKVIEELKKRKVDKKDLIIKTKLKKSLSSYKASTPHVTVARKMKDLGIPISEGTLILYYIAESKNKKALVRERTKLPEEEGKYDIKYYLNKQILPAVENIFQVFGITGEEIVEGKKQTKLDGF